MKGDLRSRALRAHYLLTEQLIHGEELAARLKTSIDGAADLARIGDLIERAEERRLTRRHRDVLKVVARVIARNTMLTLDDAKTRDVDFMAGKRTGWCATALVALVGAGLVEMPIAGRVRFTAAGWAFVWATGLIKPSWKVPS